MQSVASKERRKSSTSASSCRITTKLNEYRVTSLHHPPASRWQEIPFIICYSEDYRSMWGLYANQKATKNKCSKPVSFLCTDREDHVFNNISKKVTFFDVVFTWKKRDGVSYSYKWSKFLERHWRVGKSFLQWKHLWHDGHSAWRISTLQNELKSK